jgi:hypothetical protein
MSSNHQADNDDSPRRRFEMTNVIDPPGVDLDKSWPSSPAALWKKPVPR